MESGPVSDRREQILAAALAVLRDEGYLNLTQPRVAAKAGVRQSHITYYFPTRVDLLVAVARKAVGNQLALVDSVSDSSSPHTAAEAVATVVSRADNARVLLMLVCAADTVPEVRQLFQALATGVVEQSRKLIGSVGGHPTTEAAELLHALIVGLAAINFATGRADGEARAKSLFQTALDLVANQR